MGLTLMINVDDSGFLKWVIGGISTLGCLVVSWLNNTKVSKDTFKQYMAGQEKLTESHVKNTDANTSAIINLYRSKQDKS